jgi:glycosyltransferase involved in cell wall biosynthesis
LTRVLIICGDVVGSQMSGPAIRDWEYARELSRTCHVVLAIPNQSDLQSESFELVKYDTPGSLRNLAASADAIIISGYVLQRYPFLAELDAPLVISLPHSFVLEALITFVERDLSLRRIMHNEFAGVLSAQLQVGDFFICNSERQRDYWLGMLSTLNRVNPLTFDDDRTLRRLVDVVPFGLPDESPQHRHQVLKGVRDGIATGDKVIYWGGGIYDWLDPFTLIRAVALVSAERRDVKAFFAATCHPNPTLSPSPVIKQAMALSDELGLTSQSVFFNDWLSYTERGNYLLEADIGVSLHLNHIETRYAFRNRVLDYIWAGLPIICTKGDVAAEIVQEYGVGRVVKYEDAKGLAGAILEMLDVPDLRAQLAPHFAPLVERYRWVNCVRPLVEFCHAPRKAPDRRLGAVGQASRPREEWGTWWMRMEKGWRILRERGVRALWQEVKGFVAWRWG